MDLTDIGGAAKKDQEAKAGLPQRSQFVPAEKVGTKEKKELSVPNNPEAKEFRNNHFNIGNIGADGQPDGQVVAGEVDEGHVEFLKGTEMVD